MPESEKGETGAIYFDDIYCHLQIILGIDGLIEPTHNKTASVCGL